MEKVAKTLQELPIPLKYGVFLAANTYIFFIVLFWTYAGFGGPANALIVTTSALCAGVVVILWQWGLGWRFFAVLNITASLSAFLFFVFYYRDSAIDPGTALIGAFVGFGIPSAIPTFFAFVFTEYIYAKTRA